MNAWILPLIGYLLGSIPSAVWIGKTFYGKDVRREGSGNAGATNAFRVLGWKAGLGATVLDVGKGALGTSLPIITATTAPLGWSTQIFMLACGLSAIVGHFFPVFAGFKGGKGVNTSAGVLLMLSPVAVLVALVTFAIVFYHTRYVSLGSIIAATSLMVSTTFLWTTGRGSVFMVGAGTVIAIAVIVMHRSNIGRLRAGTEAKFTGKSSGN